jgi:uncharacterized MAPEG superfamily protein
MGNGDKTAGDILCAVFLGVRVLYPFLYIFDYAAARSSSWTIGLACILGLFINPLAS